MIRSDQFIPQTDRRWQVVVDRNPAVAETFVYAVRTTGVYCRPGCSSRLPRRENVEFFEGPVQAEIAGYRACKRCRPNRSLTRQPQIQRLIAACRFIERAQRKPSLAEVAAEAGLSPRYLLRLFREHLHVTPREYAAAVRVVRLQRNLAKDRSVTDAIHSAGYESAGRCYAESTDVLGMSPKQYRAQGVQQAIRFAVAGCSLGRVLVAVTGRGVCQISLGDADQDLREKLLQTFPAAVEITSDPALGELVSAVVRFIDRPKADVPFPLDIQGTVFQRRVWQALQAIPPGETRTYSELAEAVGQPSAVRAVASACAANTLAVAVPCHRVLRSTGALSGYRWGPQRKRALLDSEARRYEARQGEAGPCEDDQLKSKSNSRPRK